MITVSISVVCRTREVAEKVRDTFPSLDATLHTPGVLQVSAVWTAEREESS